MSDKLYTIEEAKQLLKDNWEKGIECPCCTQFVKLYKRPLYSAQAYSLIRKGTDFVEASVTVKSHIRIYDGSFYGLIGKEISIKDALGKKFNYEELMA